jgi:hypothetical protein
LAVPIPIANFTSIEHNSFRFTFGAMRPRLNTVALVYPFLLVVYFIFHRLYPYWGYVPLADVLAVTGWYLAGAALVFSSAAYWLKSRPAAALLTLLAMALYCYWKDLLLAFNRLCHIDHFVLIPVFLLLFAGLFYLLLRRYKALKEPVQARVTSFLALLMLVYIGVDIAALSYYTYRNGRQAPLIAPATLPLPGLQKASTQAPNVYFFVFDEYGSSPMLRQEAGLDNTAQEQYLMQKGFHVVPGARSNYTETHYSLASLLNMAYLDSATVADGSKTSIRLTYQKCARAIRDNRVMELFARAGYSVQSNSLFEIKGNPRPAPNLFNPGNEMLLSWSTFGYALNTAYLPYLKYKAAQLTGKNVADSAIYGTLRYNRQSLNDFYHLLRVLQRRPSFVYTHLLMPHMPFYYDSTGALLPPGQVVSTGFTGYRNNLRHANRVMKEVVEAILQKDPNPVIVLIGDHGYRWKDNKQELNKPFGVLCAVYYPDKDYTGIPADLTHVNLFRLIINKTCGTQLPLLPNKQQEMP